MKINSERPYIKYLFSIIIAISFFVSCGMPEEYESIFEEQILLDIGTSESEDNMMENGSLITTSEVEDKSETISSFSIYCTEEFGDAGFSGNNQKNVPSGNFVVFQGMILFQHDSASHGLQLYMLDPRTMKVSLFCKDPVCAHNMNSDCISASCFGNLEVVQGRLYALTTGFNLCEFDGEKFVKQIDGEIGGFWYGDNGLFAITQDKSLIRFDDSHGVEIINDSYAEYWNSNYSGKIYGNTGSTYNVLDLNDNHTEPRRLLSTSAAINDGDLIYYLEDQTLCLCTASLEGVHDNKLTDRSIMAGSMNFDSDYVYYRYLNKESDMDRAEHIIYRIPKDGSAPPEQIADIPGRIINIYTVPGCDTIFAVCFREKGEAVAKIYAVKKDGSDFCCLDIRTDF